MLVLGMEIVFTKSRKGMPVIVMGPYRFNKVVSAGPKFRWRCTRNVHGCRALVYTFYDEVIHFDRYYFLTVKKW
ncbi:unnamed protein product [Leptidea sinapis]|uniref:FLYWCH-type domain-containing protein n=1 Tax=Leptidea sinapis TaxID=189913 RepID=A0A5E4PZG0_9NEOP|nr:unnamed protein product [Leptidea sinapis]